jgi:hypothetical protein
VERRSRTSTAANGLILPNVRMLVPDEWKHNGNSLAQLAMDAAGTW